jgi:D-beta-D-heptose 7-phosphate kinase/D-beta-D-heptose 1-phosphate adenosyltransferase
VLVIGDVVADEYLVGESSRISAEAPCRCCTTPASTPRSAAPATPRPTWPSLGGQATLVALVGDDAAGTDIARRCTEIGIELVPLRDGRPTTRKVRIISQQQQLLRIDYEQTAAIDRRHEDQLLELVAARLGGCDVVVISDYAKGLLTNDVCRDVIKQAHAAGREVVIDPRPLHAAFYWSCDYLTPNWKESLGLLR